MLDLLPDLLRRILRETPELRRAYLVGGCVRDWWLGRAVKDFDVEVYGIDYERLVQALRRWGRADLVGRSFGVVKLAAGNGDWFDFSLPRRDSKVAPGHKGFAVDFDPGIPLEEASARRDFTVNALMFDPHAGRLLDFHGGEADLRQRVLRHTSSAFAEDPLRVLRGMQFCARLGLEAAPETLELCRSIASRHGELAVERIRDEWAKWATRSVEPSRGLRFLAASGWLVHYPELAALPGTPQDPDWHPEGDVWIHTGHCLDALVALPEWQAAKESDRLVLSYAVLLHDIGKPACTRREVREGRERVISPGHDRVGGPLAEAFLTRLGVPVALRDRVIPLVTQHMIHLQEPTARAVRRLADRLRPATIGELAPVITADASGRPPLPRGEPRALALWLAQARALDLEASAPRPLLLGRHLIARGLRPGPGFGQVLEEAFEAQLDGVFVDAAGADHWLTERLARTRRETL
jgi:tRNA nucleotidyltransferase (CCA-adding enzyme)